MKTCVKCRVLPARKSKCLLCLFVAEMARAHRAGEHGELNEACITCTRARTARRRFEADDYLRVVQTSHDNCSHPKTKSARTVCREHRRRAMPDA